jgi:outer membrane protein TolC
MDANLDPLLTTVDEVAKAVQQQIDDALAGIEAKKQLIAALEAAVVAARK